MPIQYVYNVANAYGYSNASRKKDPQCQCPLKSDPED